MVEKGTNNSVVEGSAREQNIESWQLSSRSSSFVAPLRRTLCRLFWWHHRPGGGLKCVQLGCVHAAHTAPCAYPVPIAHASFIYPFFMKAGQHVWPGGLLGGPGLLRSSQKAQLHGQPQRTHGQQPPLHIRGQQPPLLHTPSRPWPDALRLLGTSKPVHDSELTSIHCTSSSNHIPSRSPLSMKSLTTPCLTEPGDAG